MNPDINLLQPYWLLLLPLPWLWLYWRLTHPVSWPQILPKISMYYPLLEDIDPLKQSVKPSKKRTLSNEHIMAIALSFILLTLAQPVYYQADIEQQDQPEAVDMIIAVDTALSMSLKDYNLDGQKVSRIAASRHLLKTFINDYSGNRMGLVIMDSPPALWLPMTTDKAVMQDALTRINLFFGGKQSDLGATLNLIYKQFKDDQEKVIIVISDAGVQVGNSSFDSIAKELADNGFTLYIIVLGAAEPVVGTLADNSLLYQSVNLKLFQQAAVYGKGRLFHALDKQTFSEALQTIEKQHYKSAVLKNRLKLTTSWYPLPLVIAMFLLLYITLLNARTDAQELS